jgi:hypothetical protein
VTGFKELWDPWTPEQVAQRLSMVAAPWYVAAGWALELFTTNATREHHDVDVFREPYSGDRWVCRRNPSITMSYDELILLASSGIP